MANISVTEIADGIQNAVAQSSLPRLRSRVVMPRLANRDFDTEVAKYGQIVTVTKRGTVSRQAKAEDTDVTLQEPADTKVQVTLDKFYDVSFVMEDIAKAFAKPNYFEGYANDAIEVLAEGVEADLLALATGFSTTHSVGAYTNWGYDDIIDIRKKLVAAKAPKNQPMNLVIDETAYATLLKDTQVMSAEKVGDNVALRQASEGLSVSTMDMKRFGMDIYEHTEINAAGSPSTCTALAFSRDALTLVSRPLELINGTSVEMRTVTDPVSGLVFRIIVGYDQYKKGIVFSADTLYGVAELRDELGVKVTYTV